MPSPFNYSTQYMLIPPILFVAYNPYMKHGYCTDSVMQMADLPYTRASNYCCGQTSGQRQFPPRFTMYD